MNSNQKFLKNLNNILSISKEALKKSNQESRLISKFQDLFLILIDIHNESIFILENGKLDSTDFIFYSTQIYNVSLYSLALYEEELIREALTVNPLKMVEPEVTSLEKRILTIQDLTKEAINSIFN